jgi:hypothetical protein
MNGDRFPACPSEQFLDSGREYGVGGFGLIGNGLDQISVFVQQRAG